MKENNIMFEKVIKSSNIKRLRDKHILVINGEEVGEYETFEEAQEEYLKRYSGAYGKLPPGTNPASSGELTKSRTFWKMMNTEIVKKQPTKDSF